MHLQCGHPYIHTLSYLYEKDLRSYFEVQLFITINLSYIAHVFYASICQFSVFAMHCTTNQSSLCKKSVLLFEYILKVSSYVLMHLRKYTLGSHIHCPQAYTHMDAYRRNVLRKLDFWFHLSNSKLHKNQT